MEFFLKVGYHLAKDETSMIMIPIPWESHQLDDWERDRVPVIELHVPTQAVSFQKCCYWRFVGLLDYGIDPTLEKVHHKTFSQAWWDLTRRIVVHNRKMSESSTATYILG
ncbi:hypothetical protein QQP08_005222 [Theobroma cacao]|nr:hypothetical protein QQP08_005222 [Theobroma cacao]